MTQVNTIHPPCQHETTKHGATLKNIQHPSSLPHRCTFSLSLQRGIFNLLCLGDLQLHKPRADEVTLSPPKLYYCYNYNCQYSRRPIFRTPKFQTFSRDRPSPHKVSIHYDWNFRRHTILCNFVWTWFAPPWFAHMRPPNWTDSQPFRFDIFEIISSGMISQSLAGHHSLNPERSHENMKEGN